MAKLAVQLLGTKYDPTDNLLLITNRTEFHLILNRNKIVSC